MSDLFTIRPAQERDLIYLQIICEEGGLGIIETTEHCSVAVNSEDVPVGFIHIETVDDESPATNAAYVYPVAVFASWQHQGVARALIEHELLRVGELRLVACTSSQGFYPKVGFEQVAWENIAISIASDCDYCPNRGTCDPVPFAISVSR
ncbi:MAG: GNAT family N-acetyltransferase [Coriobacteriia bacterium]|nr:GNAT family N-acetyltransferase [Coriobacteriia bacterium]